MSARTTYVVEKDITDRNEAEEACQAVLDVLRPVLARAVVDAYTDHREQMPAQVAAIERRLHELGSEQGQRDPGMGVELVLDEHGWQLLRVYGLYAIERGRPRSRAVGASSHVTPQWSSSRSR